MFLTNALTGWEPPTGPKKQLTFPEMEEERDAAAEVKQGKPGTPLPQNQWPTSPGSRPASPLRAAAAGRESRRGSSGCS